MNIPCSKSISCDAGLQALGYDFPVANFSSERPDQAIVIGVNYGWDANAAPLGQVWSTPGCVSWCTSQVSQDEADLCAARQQLACAAGIGGGPDIPPGGDGSSNPNTPPPGSKPPNKEQMFHNSEQNCSTKCPDGTVITETVASGEVLARSQILADEIAKTTACKRLAAKAICTSGLDGFACADPFFEDDEYKHQFTASGAAPLVWTVAGGSLPPQLVLEPSGLLHGTPDTAGDYNFTVRVTNATGQTADRDCTFHVLGLDITQKALPEAKVDHPYNYVLPGKGGAMNYWVSQGSLPAGLTLSIDGIISGTPTDVSNPGFIVTISDNFLNECSQDLTLAVTGPKFLNSPPAGTQCSSYGPFGYLTNPTPCTFSGVMPGGLKISAAGVVDGCPSSPGTNVFNVTATDADGHTNTLQSTVVMAAGTMEFKTAIKDFTYTLSVGDSGGGHTTVNTASGGDISWAGSVKNVPGAASVDRRVTGGPTAPYYAYGICGCGIAYDIVVTVSYNFTKVSASATFELEVVMIGLPALLNISLASSASNTQQFVIPAATFALFAPVQQAQTFFHFSLHSNPILAGQEDTADATITIRPLIPPPPP